jgi:hypothetical protein
MHTFTRLFRDRHDAEDVLFRLRKRGYRQDEIGIVVHDAAHQGPRAGRSEEQSLGEGLPLMGAATGISAAAALAGSMLVMGPAGLLAAGPLALFLGAVGAVSAGGIAAVLIGAGIPHNEAERYADELKKGGVLLSVKPHPGDEETVRGLFSEVAGAA